MINQLLKLLVIIVNNHGSYYCEFPYTVIAILHKTHKSLSIKSRFKIREHPIIKMLIIFHKPLL